MIGINGLSLSGERRRLTRAAFVALNKFGTDAHVWIPGIGYFNGLQAGNYIDSAGTQAGLVDNPVGLVMDAEGSLGAELVTNGDFSNGLTSWIVQQPTAGSVAVLAGECRFNSTDGSLAYIQQTICTVGRTYSVNLNVVNVSSGLLAISDGGVNYITFNTTGAKSFVFVATSSVFQVKRVSGVTDITIDNISVREVTGAITATQGTTANKPILRRGAVNLLTYSEQFDDASWIKSNTSPGILPVVTANYGAAPNGSNSADRVQLDGGSSGALGNSQVAKQNLALTSGITFTFSIWMRSLTSNVSVTLFLSDSTTNINVTTEWQRFSFTRTVVTTGTEVRFAKRDTWGTPGAADLLIWGAQLELGSTASEYIPTTSAAASSTSGNYYWQFDGSNDSLALSAVPFQMADDHCVVVACNVTSFSVLRQLWFNGGASGAGRCASFFVSSGGQPAWIWRDDASVVTTQLTLSAQSANNAFVSSATKKGSTVTARLNASGPQSGSVAGIGATTVNAAFLGSLQGSGNWHLGSIYPVIAIKGTVTDADLLTLERWVGSLSGVSI